MNDLIIGIAIGGLAGAVVCYLLVQVVLKRKAQSRIEEMNTKADEEVKKARQSADRILSEAKAKAEADRLKKEAEAKAKEEAKKKLKNLLPPN